MIGEQLLNLDWCVLRLAMPSSRGPLAGIEESIAGQDEGVGVTAN
jgi:hypothetical protein